MQSAPPMRASRPGTGLAYCGSDWRIQVMSIRVLAIASEIPWPLDSGGHLRIFHLLRALAARFNVRLVVPSLEASGETRHAMLEEAGIATRIVPVGRRTIFSESAAVMRAAVRREPYVMFNRHRHRGLWRVLENEVKSFQPTVLYLNDLDSLIYCRCAMGVPTVVDMQNIHSSLAARAAMEVRGLARTYLGREARLLARMERRAAAVANTILATSDGDAAHFAGLGARNVAVVPNAVDCAAFDAEPRGRRSGPPRILYVGALSWPPNVSAVRFLATEVLPQVRQRLPDACLTIVGKDPGAEVLALGRREGVVVAANVPDVKMYFRAASLLAVPLESGGGTRLKILEAFAAGLPVVSTAVGCEGLRVTDGQQLVVAERPEFAEAIVSLLLNPARAQDLARRARELVRLEYDWQHAGARVCDAVAVIAARGAGQPPAVELAGSAAWG